MVFIYNLGFGKCIVLENSYEIFLCILMVFESFFKVNVWGKYFILKNWNIFMFMGL